VPPLRDRSTNPLLANHFVKGMGRGDFELPRGLMARFAAYHWPGNVRELRNLVEGLRRRRGRPAAERVVVGALLQANEGITDLPFKEAKERLRRELHEGVPRRAAEKVHGNISQMAREPASRGTTCTGW